jgi:Lipid A 3-O-deacylase (PagL)
MRAILFLLLSLFLLPVLTQSQSPSANLSTDPTGSSESVNPSPTKPLPGIFSYNYKELSLYAGQSIGYPLIMSSLKDQRLFLLGARYTAHWRTFKRFNLNWNTDLKPLALYSNDLNGPREYRYGGGGSLGAQLVAHTHLRWTPAFDVDGGLLAFTKQTPVPDSRRLNISLDFGPSFYIPVNDTQSVKIGVWFFHFSNGFTATRNPNMDTFMPYIAFTFHSIHPLHHSNSSS